MTCLLRALPVAAISLIAITASADPEPANPGSADVVDAPAPGNESGRLDPVDPGDSSLRVAGRGALFVPKLAVEIVLAPIHLGIWAFERYKLDDLYYRVFFNKARTVGLTPSLAYESGFGVNGMTAGARFVHRDLFGEKEHLAVVAAAGVIYRQIYSAELRSGDRFGGDSHLELDGGYEQRPQLGFFGIGNSMSTPSGFRQERARATLRGDQRIWSDLHLRAAAVASTLSFGPGNSGTPIDMAYDTTMLTGWNGVHYTYGEAELRWDSRGSVTRYEPQTFYSDGSLVAAFGGREHVTLGGSDFWRYGLDLQHFFRLGEGPRVFALRLHGEAVSGTLDEVPFSELPKLGGSVYLRGYALDRFRDRVATFGTAEYQWDLADRVSASLFVDVGRVYDSVRAIDLSQPRVGYGFAIQGHSLNHFWMQASISSSIDGGVLFDLALNPVFDLDERVRRR